MVFPRRVHAVIFDMDGLLFDTEVLYYDATRAAAADFGIDFPHDLSLRLIGLTRENIFDQMRAHFGPAFAAEAFHALSRTYFGQLLDSALRLKPGVIEMLDALDRARMPRAIATSSLRASVDHHLAHFDLAHRFDAIIAHGDYPQGKPHPAPYLAASAALGVDPRHCLALEDSHNGVRAGAAAGMMTIMVPDLLAPSDEMTGLAIHIAPDLHVVRALLDGCGLKQAT